MSREYAEKMNTLPMFRGKYEIRWNNGTWKIFDTEYFKDCQVFPLLSLALETLHA